MHDLPQIRYWLIFFKGDRGEHYYLSHLWLLFLAATTRLFLLSHQCPISVSVNLEYLGVWLMGLATHGPTRGVEPAMELMPMSSAGLRLPVPASEAEELASYGEEVSMDAILPEAN